MRFVTLKSRHAEGTEASTSPKSDLVDHYSMVFPTASTQTVAKEAQDDTFFIPCEEFQQHLLVRQAAFLCSKLAKQG